MIYMFSLEKKLDFGGMLFFLQITGDVFSAPTKRALLGNNKTFPAAFIH